MNFHVFCLLKSFAYIKTMTIYFSYTMAVLISEGNFSKGVVSTDVLFPGNSAQLLPFQSFLILLKSTQVR